MKVLKRPKTYLQALNTSIEMWRYLEDNPGDRKEDFHPSVGVYTGGCALCEWFLRGGTEFIEVGPKGKKQCMFTECIPCPLSSYKLCGFNHDESWFSKWYELSLLTDSERAAAKREMKKAAGKIRQALENAKEGLKND